MLLEGALRTGALGEGPHLLGQVTSPCPRETQTGHCTLGSGSQRGLGVTRRGDDHHGQTPGGTERAKLSQAVIMKRLQGLLTETDAPVHEECSLRGRGAAHGQQPCLWHSPPSPHPPACGGLAVSPFVLMHPSWGKTTQPPSSPGMQADSPLLEVTWLKMLRSIKRIKGFSPIPGNLP